MIYGSPVVDQIRSRGVDPEEVVAVLSVMLRAEFGDRCATPLEFMLFEARRE
jgi:hypothetical protein